MSIDREPTKDSILQPTPLKVIVAAAILTLATSYRDQITEYISGQPQSTEQMAVLDENFDAKIYYERHANIGANTAYLIAKNFLDPKTRDRYEKRLLAIAIDRNNIGKGDKFLRFMFDISAALEKSNKGDSKGDASASPTDALREITNLHDALSQIKVLGNESTTDKGKLAEQKRIADQAAAYLKNRAGLK